MGGKRDWRRGRSSASRVDASFLNELLGRSESTHRHAKPDHKARMICRQAQEALSLTLGDGGSEVLLDVIVEAVEPAPDASRLAVRVALSPAANARLIDVLEALDRHKGRLRAAVAAAITRKRAPELVFVPSMVAGEGGAQ